MKKIGKQLLSFFLTAAIGLSLAPLNALAAQWTISATLVLCANGGEFSDGSERYTTTRETTASTGKPNYVAINIPSSKVPEKAGHIFKGWSSLHQTDPTQGTSSTIYGLSVNYKNGEAAYLSNKETGYLIAVWEKQQWDVVYHYNDQSTDSRTEKKTYGTAYTIRKETPARDGYDFLGWDTDAAADTVVWKAGDKYEDNAPLTLYAVWKPHTYTITYWENGGTGGPQPQTKTHGTDLAVPSTTPVREGYTFFGWAQEENAAVAALQPGDLLENKNMELYAVWRRILPPNAVVIEGTSQAEIGQVISENLYLSAGETLTSFNILIEYPSFLSYTGLEAGEVEGDIYAAQRLQGTKHILELSCHNEAGMQIDKTAFLGRLQFSVESSKIDEFGTYEMIVQKASSFYINSSSQKIALDYTGQQELSYLPCLAREIEIVGETSISEAAAYTVRFTPENVSNQAVAWSLDNDTVAVVNDDGLLVPHKNGKVTLTARTLDGSNLTAACQVEITGQKAKIDQITVPEAIWKTEFSPECYQYVLYVPKDCDSISLQAVFQTGSLLCEGYGYCFSETERKISISSDMVSVVLTRSQEGYSDTQYILSIIKGIPDEPDTEDPDLEIPGTDNPTPGTPGTDNPNPEPEEPKQPGTDNPNPEPEEPKQPGTEGSDTDIDGTHKHTYQPLQKKAPTCTLPGSITYQCSRCTSSYTQNLSPLGHRNTELRNKKKATLTEDGYTGDTYCTDCGSKLSSGKKIMAAGQKTGFIFTDKKSGAKYKIISIGKNNAVRYEKPITKKAKTVKIPSSVSFGTVTYKVTEIAPKAFWNNTKLSKVVIGKNITKIGSRAFRGCKNLKTVTMGKNVEEAGEQAFYKCSSLSKIVIPTKVKRIGKETFYGCKRLKQITIQTKRLTSKTVGKKAFGGIHASASIKVPPAKLADYRNLLRKKGCSKKVTFKK